METAQADRVEATALGLLRQVRSDWRRQGGKLDLGAALRAYSGTPPGSSPLLQVSVLGSDGQLLASSRTPGGAGTRSGGSHNNNSRSDAASASTTGRDDFAALARAGVADTAYLSRTQLDDAAGQWVMQIGRRIEDAEGRFAGVVLVAFDNILDTEEAINVNVDQETIGLVDTGLRYQLATQSMNNEFSILRTSLRQARAAGVQTWGIDTWAVDYGVVRGDRLLGPVRSYRDPRHADGAAGLGGGDELGEGDVLDVVILRFRRGGSGGHGGDSVAGC